MAGGVRMRVLGRVLGVALLLLVLLMPAMGAMADRPSQTVQVQWWYKWDGTGTKPERPAPFHVWTVSKANERTVRFKEVTDWDYKDTSWGRRFFYLEYGDEEWYETFWKTTNTSDDFIYNDDPDNAGEAWDKYPDT